MNKRTCNRIRNTYQQVLRDPVQPLRNWTSLVMRRVYFQLPLEMVVQCANVCCYQCRRHYLSCSTKKVIHIINFIVQKMKLFFFCLSWLPEWSFAIVAAQVFNIVVTDRIIALFIGWQVMAVADEFHGFGFNIIIEAVWRWRCKTLFISWWWG